MHLKSAQHGLLTKTKIIDSCIAVILSLIGRVTGGAGYTAVIASSFMGALSGSGPGNVMATGSITIPAMKRSGFPPELAANIAREILPEEKQPAPLLCRPSVPPEAPVQPLWQREMPVAAPLFMLGAAIAPVEPGREQLRMRLTGELALRALAGSTSPFYTRLYSDGLLTRNYGCDLDCAAGTVTAVFYGESRDPDDA